MTAARSYSQGGYDEKRGMNARLVRYSLGAYGGHVTTRTWL